MLKADIEVFRSAVVADMAALNDAVNEDESREVPGKLDAAEAERFAALEAWLTEADAQIERFERIEAAVAAGSTAAGSAPNVTRDRDPFDMSEIRVTAPGSEIRAQAVTAVEAMQAPDSVRAKLVDLIEHADNRRGDLARHALLTGSPVYREGFRAALAGEHLTAEQSSAMSEARAAIGLGTGFTVPITIDPTVLHIGSGSANPFREIATVRTVLSSQDSVNTLGDAVFSFDAEAAEVSDDTPADATVTITPKKAQGSVLYTVEAAADFPTLEADLLDAIAFGKDNLETSTFTNGLGTGNNPQGVVVGLAGTASEMDTAVASTFAIGDVYELRDALPARYRANASWLAEQAVYSDIRRFDTSGGAGMWTQLVSATPDELIGRPIYDSSSMDTTTTTPGSEILIYGDFAKGYRIVDRVGLAVEPFMHTGTTANLPNGVKGLYCYWRVGAAVTNINALRQLQVKA